MKCPYFDKCIVRKELASPDYVRLMCNDSWEHCFEYIGMANPSKRNAI